MKYAAKRIWPEQPKSWELQGEAETPEAFALIFANGLQLKLDTRFMVVERETEDAEMQLFRVVNCSPYQIGPAESGVPSAAADPAPTSLDETDSAAEPVGVPSLAPIISMILYMAKVGTIAVIGIAIMGVAISYLKKAIG